MSLDAENLSYSAGGRQLLEGVSLRLQAGEVHAVIGPNGAGKSMLLKLLAGDLKPQSGSISLNGKALKDWSAGARARCRAVLPQSESLRFGFTAEQVVQLGRMPCKHHRPEREREIVHAALRTTGVERLAQRKYPTLSGGERSRVQFARVLAQIWEPVELGDRYLLLDEPTASLDLAHQHACLTTARQFATQGVGVLAVLHDPNLALTYADQVNLLCCGQLIAAGPPESVLTPQNLERVYGVKIEVLRSENSRAYIAVKA